MKTEDIPHAAPSKWIPITDPVHLAALGKLQEELGELVAIIGRCIIQGIDECDPETGKSNRVALGEELGDVCGLSELVITELTLPFGEIRERADRKLKMKLKWLGMLR